ncbi:MAG: lipoyl protein ligase domain-containing protein [Gemmatimonadota bacterium]
MLPAFRSVTVHNAPLREGVATEPEWIAQVAASGVAQAHLWQGEPGWSVPRSYARSPAWGKGDRGLSVRVSGGGLVPQGPGLENLSLIWCSSAAPSCSDAVYRGLCAGLQRALARLGVIATTQAVAGSFCDGRYNLAADGRKIAGTAQAWRRIEGRQVVLAHALLIVDADVEALTDAANAIEQALGRPTRYRADAVTSIARAWSARHQAPVVADFAATLRQAIAAQFV